MGAWAYGSFDNDDGLDMVDEIIGAANLEPISLAFTAVLRVREDYLEEPKASRGLAAAEAIAALLGNPVAKLPEEIVAWVTGKKPPDWELVGNARKVVIRILRDSQLADLWAKSADSGLLWQKEVEDLLRRLGAAPD
jgi:Domain of unknown function (DUF4259)